MKTLEHNESTLILFISLIFTPMGILVAFVNVAAALSVVWKHFREQVKVVKTDYGGNWKAYFKDANPFS